MSRRGGWGGITSEVSSRKKSEIKGMWKKRAPVEIPSSYRAVSEHHNGATVKHLCYNAKDLGSNPASDFFFAL